MSYSKLIKSLELLKETLNSSNSKAILHVDVAATKEEIEETERKLRTQLPNSLKEFFSTVSKDINFFIDLDETLLKEIQKNKKFFDIGLFELNISLSGIIDAQDSIENWVNECFFNPEDDYDKVWHNKLGLMCIGNGDVIALDLLSDKDEPNVVYLSHDDAEEHGWILGLNFESYITNYVGIACSGLESWGTAPFITDPKIGIDMMCDNAIAFRQLLGLPEDIDKKDSRGRTTLINSIVQRKPIDIIESIIMEGANLELKDKLGDTALKKAIKFKRVDVVELLIKRGVNIQSENIENSPWFFARKNKKIADILLETKGSIRLTLSSDEENILEELLYNEDIDDICSKIENLDSPEILHAFILDFNYDDEWLPIITVLNNDNCKEITAIEIIELLTDGDISHLKIIDEKIFNLISIKYSDLILRLKTNMHL